MKINWKNLKGHPEAPFIALDVIVLLLITGNLLWLLLDAIMLNTGIGVLIARHYPEISHYYKASGMKTCWLPILFLRFSLLANCSFVGALPFIEKHIIAGFFILLPIGTMSLAVFPYRLFAHSAYCA